MNIEYQTNEKIISFAHHCRIDFPGAGLGKYSGTFNKAVAGRGYLFISFPMDWSLQMSERIAFQSNSAHPICIT